LEGLLIFSDLLPFLATMHIVSSYSYVYILFMRTRYMDLYILVFWRAAKMVIHVSLRSDGRIPDERGWFDRNCPYRARSLLGDHKLEEPSRELPAGLGIDPRHLSAYHHFLQVSRRILHHHQVAFVLPTPP
jgi:hypothetical protein